MLRNSLLWKLILAFLTIAILATALMAIFIRLTSVDRLTRLVIDQQRSSLATSLTDYYSARGSWQGIEINWQHLRLRSSSFSTPPGQNFGPNPSPNQDPGQVLRSDQGFDRRRLFGLADSQGKVLVSVDPNYPNGSALPSEMLKQGEPLQVNGQPVGTILTAHLTPRLNPEERLFLQRTNDAIIFSILGATLVALIIAVFLAQTLIRPLRALTSAAQNIAQGHWKQEVKVTSKDEIGQLAEAFNSMSQEVVRVNQQRKQMTADIAHDLRTPLTVIAGYVESMRDGVLQATPERLSIIYTEIERLQNLVGDLKMLSQADAGELPLHPLEIDPKSLLEHGAAPFQHRAEQQQIQLTIQADENLPEVRVDEARMMQVFGNLISNALRYTPAGGTICLSARRDNGHVILSVADTGEGIVEEELPYIFERFHRADKSRHTEAGESGLGLAIVKALVEAQDGQVQALSRPGEGTNIQITLSAVRAN